MTIDDLLHQPGEWVKGSGPNSNIVLSSRIRLARNLASAPFPNRANAAQRDEVLKKVEAAIREVAYLRDSMLLKLETVNELDRVFLVERHLMSHDLAVDPVGRGLLVSREEMLSIMINEEDHLRLQVIHSGFKLDGAWQIIDTIDNELSKVLPYAFLPDFGYLTACPTNTGTAMRASVMLYLPGLAMTGLIDQLLGTINQLHFVARGFYGEGSEALGNCYQVSNQVSLGPGEQDIVQQTSGLIERIIEQETMARETLFKNHRTVLEDRTHRAWGILKNARIISSQEAIELVSMARLGIDTGILEGVDYRQLNEVFLMIHPAHLQKLAGRPLDPGERDERRAELIRERL